MRTLPSSLPAPILPVLPAQREMTRTKILFNQIIIRCFWNRINSMPDKLPQKVPHRLLVIPAAGADASAGNKILPGNSFPHGSSSFPGIQGLIPHGGGLFPPLPVN